MCHKSINQKIYFILIVLFVFLCLSYSLGAFNRILCKTVDEKYYPAGDFSYSGSLLNGKFEGQGKLFFSNGSVCDGIFKKGNFSGEIKYLDEDKVEFQGYFENDHITQMSWTSGNYKASIDTTGKISYLSSKGWSYNGNFDSCGQNEDGTLIWSDGSKYEGQFSHCFSDGEGTYYSEEGSINYQGGLKNGLFHGYGDYFFNDTQYIGDFVNGLPDGKGIYKSRQGWNYEGSFKEGIFDGEGTITDRSGNKFTGTWKKGKRVI